MVNASNIYADKILQHHPVALWTLDSDAKYLSLITDAERDFTSGWTFSSSFLSVAVDETQDPYYKLDTTVTELYKNSVSTGTSFTATSNYTFDSNSDSFSIGLYVLKTSPYITSIDIGYKVGGTTTYASTVTISAGMYNWQFVSATFNTTVTTANIVLRFNYSTPATADKVGIIVNGLTVGKWSEDFNVESTGSQKIALSDINTTQTHGIVASQYNTAFELSSGTYTDIPGYYIVSDDVAYARNTGHPMVFGCTNSTKIYPHTTAGEPSLILPGYGFLNESDKYKTRTFELWLRVNSSATSIKRILGPITGSDGLYVDNANLILKVSDKFVSYYVGEWDRPMLVQMISSKDKIEMFINGDSVSSISYDVADITFEDYESSTLEQDWIGFYAYSDVSLDVSCVAIYNYAITKATALSRWSYGQAVSFPKEVVSAYSGSYIVPDYTFAKYANNQNYGVLQNNTWKSGKINNFVIDRDTLSLPEYSLPTIEIDSTSLTQEDMFTALSTANATYIDLQPDSSWNGVQSHILFDTFKPIINDVNMFYVVFDKSENNTDNKQIIFQIVDKITGNYLEASILSNTLGYYFYYNSTTPVTVGTYTASATSTKYAAAINIPNLIASNSNFTNFFSNKENLEVYVGGSKDFTADQTLTGKVYKVGFGDSRNYDKVSSSFNSSGYYAAAAAGVLDTHTASYTLLVQNPWTNQSFMDIAVNSYWQDAIPLSRLSKTVDGQYKIDYLQFNIDYPNQIDTTSADTKTYLTFQTVESGMSADVTTFANTTVVGSDRYINVTPTYSDRKYQVVDGTVIYVPTDVSPNTLAVVTHIEVNSPGIILNPTKIRSLQIAAQALGSETTIGTKGDELISFGTGNNPILISKFNDQYYYLTSQSGFRVVGTNASSRGYYSNINEDKHDTFSIGSIQFSAKFLLTEFANTEKLMFELENVDDATKVKFYVIGETSALTRGRIYAKDQSGTAYTNLKYYLNGVEVDRAIVSADEWFMLSIKFTTDYSLDSKAGKFNFSGQQLINHFEYFQPNASQRESPRYIYPKWINVRYSGTASKTWTNYTASTWQTVATSPSTTVPFLSLRLNKTTTTTTTTTAMTKKQQQQQQQQQQQ